MTLIGKDWLFSFLSIFFVVMVEEAGDVDESESFFESFEPITRWGEGVLKFPPLLTAATGSGSVEAVAEGPLRLTATSLIKAGWSGTRSHGFSLSKGLIKLPEEVDVLRLVVVWKFWKEFDDWFCNRGSKPPDSASVSEDLNSSDLTEAVETGGRGLAARGEGRLSSASGTVESVISAWKNTHPDSRKKKY